MSNLRFYDSTARRNDTVQASIAYADGTGLELCRKIRKFDERTPIVFYSGVSDAPHIKQAMEAGAQGLLIKPVGIDELLQEVVRYTGVGNK